MLDTFKTFLADTSAEEMFVTGRAGTGKTTQLAELLHYCIEHDIPQTVCAYTHKACGVLKTKLPDTANVKTLHKFLKKRPTINQEAKHHKHVESNARFGEADTTGVLFIDEYSMVGEMDLMDLREVQDEQEGLKIVWLGDPHQLPPVGDAQSVVPYGKYAITLTKVYRQAADNPLMDTLDKIVDFIEGAEPAPLESNESFIRDQDIGEWYDNDRLSDSFDGVMLAFTNERVQLLNQEAQGYKEPRKGDILFSPTTKHHYTFIEFVETVPFIDRPFGEPLEPGSKYKTYEYLMTQGYKVALVQDDDGEEYYFMCVFGHYDYKCQNDMLKKAAAESNKAIGASLPEGQQPAQWAKANRDDPKARSRAKAWRAYLSFNEAVICLDFAHAMTVHKSQGSTYKSVYLDIQDLGRAADINYINYLKLLYVATSRASKYVVTN